MYLKFYGLDEKPFSETPDPRFLFLSPAHREALAQLQYCAEERKGFVVLTGEIGTGKTTLLNTLYRRLDPKTAVAFIVNSRLPFDGLLECILDDLGVAGARDVGVFTEPAVARMAAFSRGVPRVLNILGDHCLLFGYAEQKRRIERQTVDQTIEYLEASAQAQRRGWGVPGLGVLRR